MFKTTWAIAPLMVAGGHALRASQIQVDFAGASLVRAPGDSLQFFATLTNLSTADTIYFNSISVTGVSGDLAFEITPFILDAPLFLDPGESSGPFEIFDVAIDPGAIAGDYPGNTVFLLGGTDSGALDDLADSLVEVDVDSARTTATPEPSSFLLAAAVVAWFVFRTRSARTTQTGRHAE